MEGSPLISIIIPIYNVEKYLPACLDSVLAQTYQNLEIILVDDGSPDGSGAICDAYAARDARIRVIHQKNGGVSSARNTGLDAAFGSFIGFVDPDDYIEPDMYRILYKRIQDTGADIAQCGYMYHKNETVTNVYGSGENDVYSGPQCAQKLLTDYAPWWTVWSKLYRADLFRELRFCKVNCCEDILLNSQLFLRVRHVVFVKEPLYHWIWYPASLSKFSLRTIDTIKGAKWIWEGLDQSLPHLSGLGCRHFAMTTISFYENLWFHRAEFDRQTYTEAMNHVRSELRKERRRILKTPECGKKFRIKTCLITMIPHLYLFLFPLWLKMKPER